VRFLLAQWDGGGNAIADLALARVLVDRGHEVHVVGDDTLAEDAEAVGASFEPWATAPHLRARDKRRALIRDWETRNPVTQLRQLRDHLVSVPAASQAADVGAVVRRVQPDVLLADGTIPGALAAGEAAGVPTVALLPNVNMFPAPDLPPMGSGLVPGRGVASKARDAVLRRLTGMFEIDVRALSSARVDLGLPPVTSLTDAILRADLVLLLTSGAFDVPTAHLPANVVYGGIPGVDHVGDSWSPPWQRSGVPRVLIALGTTYQDQGRLLGRTVEALGSIDCEAIVTSGPLRTGRTPPNVHAVRSAPHGLVLADVDLCVTHGGHGTVVRALAAAVPLVVVPGGRDQADNAARVVRLGAGVRLPARPSAERLRAAIAGALADTALRDRARRAADLLAPDLGAPRAVTLLEHLRRSPYWTNGTTAPHAEG
jgi:MGT family glycosyltransferase